MCAVVRNIYGGVVVCCPVWRAVYCCLVCCVSVLGAVLCLACVACVWCEEVNNNRRVFVCGVESTS